MKKISEEKLHHILLLVCKVAVGDASIEESDDLRRLETDFPFQETIKDLKSEVTEMHETDFMEKSLRVLFKNATVEEIREHESLRPRNAKLWQKLCEVVFVFKTSVESSQLAKAQPLPDTEMPQKVKDQLLRELAKQRKFHSSRANPPSSTSTQRGDDDSGFTGQR